MFEEIKKLALDIGCNIKENVDMKDHTSFKTGGPAALIVYPDYEDSLSEIIKACKKSGVKPLVLGNCSNVLMPDEGYNNLIIQMTDGFNDLEYCGNGLIECGAGVSLSKLCNFALEHALSGLEFAFGIPGSAGGATYMNAGAYGGEMKDVVMLCNHVDSNGDKGSFKKDELDFSYRHSIYGNNGSIITSMILRLEPSNTDAIKSKMDNFLKCRKEKQPLEYPSAGSIFKRPEGYYAGALIEQCALKGHSIGGAQVSEKHAGFIINKGGATTKDVTDLIAYVQKTVKEQTGVLLEKEVKVI